jgi:predicted ArsR family transcriptional regulator
MLIAELEAIGPASASDERLLKRLGWTRSRASQVFKQLEEAGVVRAAMEAPEGGGRPRKVFRPVGPIFS